MFDKIFYALFINTSYRAIICGLIIAISIIGISVQLYHDDLARKAELKIQNVEIACLKITITKKVDDNGNLVYNCEYL